MKNSIFCFVDYFRPGYKAGGSVTAIYSLINTITQYNFILFTRNHDKGDRRTYTNEETNPFQKENIHIFYGFSIFKIYKQLKKYPSTPIYLNSFFSYKYSILWIALKKIQLIKNPIILAPRGELISEALEIKSQKKRIYLNLAHKLSFYKNVVFHSTTPLETEEIQKNLKSMMISYKSIIEAPELLYLDKPKTIKNNSQKCLKIVFLGRIHPIKNLTQAIRILHESKLDFIFDIYGPEDEKSPHYKTTCENLITQLNLESKIKFRGAINPSEISKTFEQYDFLLAPSQSENFGYFIIEAMMSGLLPIVSSNTPWTFLKNEPFACIFDLNRQADAVSFLRDITSLNPDQILKLKLLSSHFAEAYVRNNNPIEKYKLLFYQ
ncbi:MAG: glycosyltransferase [Bdellovibrionales bacterium]|nr:glycosyltransferase [Bdellovibrionales bacterium]